MCHLKDKKSRENSNSTCLMLKCTYLCADFTGLHCVVSNSLGEGSPCPAEVVLEVELSRLQQQELVIILVICGVTLTLLLLLALATCYYCSRRHKQPDKGEQPNYLVLDKSSYLQQASPFLICHFGTN